MTTVSGRLISRAGHQVVNRGIYPSRGPIGGRISFGREAFIPGIDALDAKTELRPTAWHPYILARE